MAVPTYPYLVIVFYDAAGRVIASVDTGERDTPKVRATYQRSLEDPITCVDYPDHHKYEFRTVERMVASIADEVPMASPLQELAAMRRRSDELEAQITEAEEAYGIRLLREQKAQVDADFSARLAEVAPTLSYGEDKFLKALKKKGESYREGGLRIIRTSRTTRVVRVGEFARAFPSLIRARLGNPNMTDEAAMRLLLESGSKIELAKIDALVGKVTVKNYCDEKVAYSYEFLSMPENVQGEV